jgi:RimJ/RimL family protein N-acetyltransferase
MYFGEKVCLRALEMTDLDDILKFWNTYEMRRFLGSTIPFSRSAEQEWLEGATKEAPWKDGRFVLAITDKVTGEFLGTTSLFDISAQMRRAEFGIAIHNLKNLSKGYGSDTARVMLWIGFHVLGLNTIYLYALAENPRAIRAYEKAGFRMIGVFREAAFSEGAFKDLVAMDVTAREFFEEYPPGTKINDEPNA